MKKNDILLAIVLLIFAGIAFAVIGLLKAENGGQAVVYVDGEVQAVYELSSEGSYEIITKNGENILEIKDGKADMTHADCPDGLCVQQAAISKKGETIVCLPHKVVVEIEGGEAAEMDAIAQ